MYIYNWITTLSHHLTSASVLSLKAVISIITILSFILVVLVLMMLCSLSSSSTALAKSLVLHWITTLSHHLTSVSVLSLKAIISIITILSFILVVLVLTMQCSLSSTALAKSLVLHCAWYTYSMVSHNSTKPILLVK